MSSTAPVSIKLNDFNLLIGTILIIIKPNLKLEQIKKALEEQEKAEETGEHKRIGEILIAMNAISSENLDVITCSLLKVLHV